MKKNEIFYIKIINISDASNIRPLVEQEELNMSLMKKRFSRRLNINVRPKTYEEIRKVANQENRKTGSMAREILERWAMNRKVLK